eukprot:CAMPEP_0113475766 /NCGR_PEP_ID=MMETSP0014_2-20120614/19298_1 /TAXON_ID=2857 /ORGANISM="Nitzschia sp." /LENGTH=90 /DNA_ID=CAMNT_0000368713 /DNA_START=256 /DNA_END=524 /DNA_ORIENTATION=+ /assembly_acc=CAM_ASM_000159
MKSPSPSLWRRVVVVVVAEVELEVGGAVAGTVPAAGTVAVPKNAAEGLVVPVVVVGTGTKPLTNRQRCTTCGDDESDDDGDDDGDSDDGG